MMDIKQLAEKIILECPKKVPQAQEFLCQLLNKLMEEVKKETWDDAMSFHKAEQENTVEKAYDRAAEVARNYKDDGCVVSEAGQRIAAAIEKLKEDK